MFELADFPMMRKCLLGIKRRAEAQVANVRASSSLPEVPAASL